MYIHNIYQKMMLFRKQWRHLLLSNSMRFGGGGTIVYDWRDDHKLNPDYEQDTRDIGVPDVRTYKFPHEEEPYHHKSVFPENYDPKNLTMLYRGPPVGPILNQKNVQRTNYLQDIAHEKVYESEDLDFQPESFKSQHFRKKGPYWIWWVMCTIPFSYSIMEYLYQGWPDVDNWRYQRPPPLDFPDDSLTADTETAEIFKSKGYRALCDAGLVNQPFFEIVEGKKVYSKYAGVNEPMEVI